MVHWEIRQKMFFTRSNVCMGTIICTIAIADKRNEKLKYCTKTRWRKLISSLHKRKIKFIGIAREELSYTQYTGIHALAYTDDETFYGFIRGFFCFSLLVEPRDTFI